MLTDYLEALLELEQERQEEDGVDWSARSRMVAWVGKTGQSGGEPDEAEHGRLRPASEEKTGVHREKTETVQKKERETFRLAERLRQLRGSVERGIAQRSRNAAAESVQNGAMAAFLPGGKPTLRGAMDYAALVDAAFQRDARRYDGQLGLL